MDVKTKFVYVLVCNKSNFYFEQFLISAYSLLKHTPAAYICLVVDELSAIYIEERKADIVNLVSDIIVVDTPMDYNNMRKSRYIKTNLRKIVKGDFLFIDTDTVVCDDLSSVDDIPYDIASVPDQHVMISSFHPQKSLKSWSKIAGFKLISNYYYFNSGVIYCKDNHRTSEFYSEWNKHWKLNDSHGLSYDQPSFAKANEVCGYLIGKLDGVWKCQIVENGLRYLQESKIIHYFSSGNSSNKQSAYLFYDEEIYKKIRCKGLMCDDIQMLLSNPRSAFRDDCKVITGDDSKYLLSIANIIYKTHPRIFKVFEKFSSNYLRFNRCLKLIRNGLFVNKIKTKYFL